MILFKLLTNKHFYRRMYRLHDICGGYYNALKYLYDAEQDKTLDKNFTKMLENATPLESWGNIEQHKRVGISSGSLADVGGRYGKY